MENATKALLIAAAVLIAIVLIALGVRLIGAAGDTSTQAEDVSNQLNTSIGQQVTSVNEALKGLEKTPAATH